MWSGASCGRRLVAEIGWDATQGARGCGFYDGWTLGTGIPGGTYCLSHIVVSVVTTPASTSAPDDCTDDDFNISYESTRRAGSRFSRVLFVFVTERVNIVRCVNMFCLFLV